MKLFDARQSKSWGQNGHTMAQAIAHAGSGDQALHVWFCPGSWLGAPTCFARTSKAGRPWAQLFDQDQTRLAKTARDLGVKRIVISRPGQPGQHIDLCGQPLTRAISLCENTSTTNLVVSGISNNDIGTKSQNVKIDSLFQKAIL